MPADAASQLNALGFQYRYVAGSASSRTLLLLHGTGGDENDLLDLGRTIAPQAGLLSPRGKVLERGMPRFFRRLAEGVFDEQDLLSRTDELAQFVEAAARELKLNASGMTAVGFSNGANIAAAMLLKRPGVLAAAVLMRAMVPFEPAALPQLNQTPVLLLAGQSDPIVPRAQTERLAELLRAAGAEVTLQWTNAGHGLITADVQAAGNWLSQLPV